jgi:hypothetical protein
MISSLIYLFLLYIYIYIYIYMCVRICFKLLFNDVSIYNSYPQIKIPDSVDGLSWFEF